MKKINEIKYDAELNKGITLIALIITIIIMLILAGVTLSIVLGDNGLINKTKQAVKVHDVETIKEALELEKIESYMSNGRLNLDDFLEQISECKVPINSVSVGSNTGDSAEIIINGEHKFIVIADGNGDLDIEYVGAGKFGVLTLSPTSGMFTYPTSGTFKVTNNSTGGALSVSSNAPDVATASISGNTITITPGTTAGKARIIVTSAAVGEYAENRAIYMATVENGTITISAMPYEGTYDGSEHDALTNVSISPTGMNIEYSIDGVTFSSTMPTVTGASTYTITVKASKEGYKTQIETYTVTVDKAEQELMLSATSGTYIIGRTSYFTVSGNAGTISATSDDTSIATVNLSGNTITVTPKAIGTATITVKSEETSNYKEKTATYTVTVPNNYAVGDSVTVGGYDFYAIGDNGTNVTLLYKTTLGTANWSNAKSQARTFGSNLGGSGRLMTKAEAEGVAASYRNIGTAYWLEDYWGISDYGYEVAWRVTQSRQLQQRLHLLHRQWGAPSCGYLQVFALRFPKRPYARC